MDAMTDRGCARTMKMLWADTGAGGGGRVELG